MVLAVLVLAACTALLFGMSLVEDLMPLYLLIGSFHVLFEFLYALSSVQVARRVKHTRYSSILSINMIVALSVQTLVQFLVGTVWSLDIQTQFQCYGIVEGIATLMALIGGALFLWSRSPTPPQQLGGDVKEEKEEGSKAAGLVDSDCFLFDCCCTRGDMEEAPPDPSHVAVLFVENPCLNPSS